MVSSRKLGEPDVPNLQWAIMQIYSHRGRNSPWIFAPLCNSVSCRALTNVMAECLDKCDGRVPEPGRPSTVMCARVANNPPATPRVCGCARVGEPVPSGIIFHKDLAFGDNRPWRTCWGCALQRRRVIEELPFNVANVGCLVSEGGRSTSCSYLLECNSYVSCSRKNYVPVISLWSR